MTNVSGKRRQAMNVTVTGFVEGKKIHAINGLRGATGMSLKEAKDVADAVAAGTPTQITVSRGHLHHLEEFGVSYHKDEVRIAIPDLVEILGRYPRDLTIGQLVDVLGSTTEFLR
jgi:hypothetical protein